MQNLNLSVTVLDIKDDDITANAKITWNDSDPLVTSYELICATGQVTEHKSGTIVKNLAIGDKHVFILIAYGINGSLANEIVEIDINWPEPDKVPITLEYLPINIENLECSIKVSYKKVAYVKKYSIYVNQSLVKDDLDTLSIVLDKLKLDSVYDIEIRVLGKNGKIYRNIVTTQTPTYAYKALLDDDERQIILDRYPNSKITNPTNILGTNKVYLYDLGFEETSLEVFNVSGHIEPGVSGVAKAELVLMPNNSSEALYIGIPLGLDGKFSIQFNLGNYPFIRRVGNKIYYNMETNNYLLYVRLTDNLKQRTYSSTQSFTYWRTY